MNITGEVNDELQRFIHGIRIVTGLFLRQRVLKYYQRGDRTTAVGGFGAVTRRVIFLVQRYVDKMPEGCLWPDAGAVKRAAQAVRPGGDAPQRLVLLQQVIHLVARTF